MFEPIDTTTPETELLDDTVTPSHESKVDARMRAEEARKELEEEGWEEPEETTGTLKLDTALGTSQEALTDFAKKFEELREDRSPKNTMSMIKSARVVQTGLYLVGRQAFADMSSGLAALNPLSNKKPDSEAQDPIGVRFTLNKKKDDSESALDVVQGNLDQGAFAVMRRGLAALNPWSNKEK